MYQSKHSVPDLHTGIGCLISVAPNLNMACIRDYQFVRFQLGPTLGFNELFLRNLQQKGSQTEYRKLEQPVHLGGKELQSHRLARAVRDPKYHLLPPPPCQGLILFLRNTHICQRKERKLLLTQTLQGKQHYLQLFTESF